MADLVFPTVGFGARRGRLRRRLGPAAPGARRRRRRRAGHRAAARAPAGVHRRQAHRAARAAARRDDAPVIDVDRGGKITFHGPGQLVGYPIVRLPDHVLVVDYVRRLEEALIHTCTDLGVTTARVPGRSGVWLPRRTTAARSGRSPRSASRVSRGVTMHGFALNCDVDLGWYDRFVPCGISDAGVTSLTAELGRDVTVAEVAPVAERHLRELLAWAPYDPDAGLPGQAGPGPAGRAVTPCVSRRSIRRGPRRCVAARVGCHRGRSSSRPPVCARSSARRGRRVVAVDDLDLAVAAGGVHGFLGPNGSGKTTTIRMLLGLARASGGEMRLFGEPVPQAPARGDRPRRRGRRAAQVHADVHRTRNLTLLARTIGAPDARASTRRSTQVGLRRARPGPLQELLARHEAAAGDRRDAAASRPELLILDEPTNGLDPAGIRDIRDMIRALGESGVTVLLSSHILAEVQQVCDSVSIIGEGRLLASGPVDELVGAGACARSRLGVADPRPPPRVLTRARYRVDRDGDRLHVEVRRVARRPGAGDQPDAGRAGHLRPRAASPTGPTWSRSSCELTAARACAPLTDRRRDDASSRRRRRRRDAAA